MTPPKSFAGRQAAEVARIDTDRVVHLAAGFVVETRAKRSIRDGFGEWFHGVAFGLGLVAGPGWVFALG